MEYGLQWGTEKVNLMFSKWYMHYVFLRDMMNPRIPIKIPFLRIDSVSPLFTFCWWYHSGLHKVLHWTPDMVSNSLDIGFFHGHFPRQCCKKLSRVQRRLALLVGWQPCEWTHTSCWFIISVSWKEKRHLCRFGTTLWSDQFRPTWRHN